MEKGDLYRVGIAPEDYQDEEPGPEELDRIRPIYQMPELPIKHPREYKGNRFQSSNGNNMGNGRRRYGQTSSKIDGADHNKYYESYRGPKAASRASRHREGTLPIEKKVNFSGIRSASANVTRITNEKNSTGRTSQGPKAASRASNHREVTLPNQKQVGFSGIRSEIAAVKRVTGEQTVRNSQGPKAASRASSHREVILPNQKQVWIRAGSHASVTRVAGEQTVRISRVESKNQGNVSNNAVKTSQIESSSSDSRIFRGNGGTKANNHKGKPDHTPKYLSAEKSKDFTPPFQKSQRHSTPSSHQVLEKQVGSGPSEKPSKLRRQPSEKPSKQPSEQDRPTYHISWDGFDDPTTQPFERNCHLCDDDLAYSPTEEELDPSILPAVSVLSCGHAFHCPCLELFTSEEQSTDPQCFICFSLS